MIGTRPTRFIQLGQPPFRTLGLIEENCSRVRLDWWVSCDAIVEIFSDPTSTGGCNTTIFFVGGKKTKTDEPPEHLIERIFRQDRLTPSYAAIGRQSTRYDYCGEVVPRFVPVSVYEGYKDSLLGCKVGDNLYRSTKKRIFWRVGFLIEKSTRWFRRRRDASPTS